jgi:hypothetical protein
MASEQVADMLDCAGICRDASPGLASFLCQTALERLCRAVTAASDCGQRQVQLDGLNEQLEWIVKDCEVTGRVAEGRIWERFRLQSGAWSRLRYATPKSVIAQLLFWHSTSWDLACIHDPSLRGCSPLHEPLHGLQGGFNTYCSGRYGVILKTLLQEQTQFGKHAESLYTTTESNFRDVAQRAEQARAAMAQLERQVVAFDSNPLPGELGGKAEESCELEVKRAELAQECERLRNDVLRSEVLRKQLALELERLAQAEQSNNEQLEELRVQLEKAASGRTPEANAQKAEQELAAARRENEAVPMRQESSPRSAQIKELLRNSERRVVELAEKERRLLGEVERYLRERNEAVGRAEVVELQLRQLRDELACEAEVRQQLERAEARRRRYEYEYPGIERAHEFFQSAIEGDNDGALPPLSGLCDFRDLGFDRYARRQEASHASGACTLRVISVRPGVGNLERCRAWEIEAWNLSRMGELPARLGVAQLVESAARDRPGFSLFHRPNSPLLSSFGFECRTLRLATALRFSLALAEVLAARAQARMSASWPDFHAVAVQQGAPRLLEPTAPHFGDLGPAEDLEKTADHCVELSRDKLEAGWAFAVAHAMLRVIGVLPSGRLSEASVDCLDRRWLRTRLEELRRACDEPISQTALDVLAVSLIDVMQGRSCKHNCLDDLLKAIRDPLSAR